MTGTLTITLQKTTDGRDYVQIGDHALLSVNIVLIADEIDVKDLRPQPEGSDG